MSESKWTPGPWFFGPMPGWMSTCYARRPPSEYGQQGTIGDAPIATVVDKAPHWENSYPVEANARLISASPDLAEVAEELIRIDANLSGQDRDDAMSDLILKARAALAKARGEA